MRHPKVDIEREPGLDGADPHDYSDDPCPEDRDDRVEARVKSPKRQGRTGGKADPRCKK